MAITKEQLIADIELQLNQGAPSIDTELEYEQIAQWINVVRNDLVAREVDAALKRGDQVLPIYVGREVCNQLAEEDVACVDEENERMGFSLTGEVLDTDNDNGILQVLTDTYDEVYKGSLELLPVLKKMTYTKSSAELLIWSRQGNEIFVEGFNEADIEFNNINVYFLRKIDLNTMASTDIIPVSDKLLPVLIARVVEMGKLQMYGTEADQATDGVDTKNVVYHRSIQNPATE